MSRSKRDNMKRDAAQVVLHIERAQENTANLWREFNQQQHPYVDALNVILLKLEECKTLTLAFADVAWSLNETELQNFRT